MKTTNWQSKSLTLFIAASALWLTAACAGDSGIQVITPAAPCGDYYGERRLKPSVEFQHFPGRYNSGDYNIDYQDWSRAVGARSERLKSEKERVRAIVKKYDYLFRVPSFYNPSENIDVYNWGQSSIDTENGLPTDQLSILISVDVHPTLLEPRIPECLDGFPVIFEYHPDFGKPIEPPLEFPK